MCHAVLSAECRRSRPGTPVARLVRMGPEDASLFQGIAWQTEFLVVARVALAMLLGGIVGFERELTNRSAGLRTHMLIAGAAALIVGLGRSLSDDFADAHFRELVRIDPVRLIEAIVAAVGFVGAGTIIKRREGDEVQGLTTAAGLLMVAGIGIAVGLAHLVIALGACVLCLVVVVLLRILERRAIHTKTDVSGAAPG
jgi:putative Mg2+ transporter-C (MgtC) family protein